VHTFVTRSRFFAAIAVLIASTALGVGGLGSVAPVAALPSAVGSGPAGGIIRAIAPLSDGRFVIGGDFDTYNGLEWSALAVLNADGSLDPSFGGATSGNSFRKGGGSSRDVYAVAVQRVSGVDKILVSTLFPAKFYCNHSDSNPTCTQATQLLVRLNLDGSVDTSFNQGGTGPLGIDGAKVTSIQIQANGDILISGSSMTSYNGTATHGIAVLNADGTLKTAAASITNRTNNPVKIAIANAAGTMYYGPGSVAAGGYAQQTASIATLATPTPGLTYGGSSLINAFVPTSDGGMIAVGAFASQFGGQDLVPRSLATRGTCIGKYDADGTLNNTFNNTASNIVTGCSETENGLTAAIEDANKNIIFAGYFDGSFRLAKFNEAGTVLSKWTPGVGGVMANGGANKVIVAGTSIARIDTTSGVVDSNFPAPNNQYLTRYDYQTSSGTPITEIRETVGTAINITPVLTPSTNVGTVTYSLPFPSDLPAGLSFDQNTGAITGTLTTAQNKHLLVVATSELGKVSNGNNALPFFISDAQVPNPATPVISSATIDSTGRLCVTFTNPTQANMVIVGGGEFASAAALFFATTSPACSSTATLLSGASVNFVAGSAYLVRVRVGGAQVSSTQLACPCAISSPTPFAVVADSTPDANNGSTPETNNGSTTPPVDPTGGRQLVAPSTNAASTLITEANKSAFTQAAGNSAMTAPSSGTSVADATTKTVQTTGSQTAPSSRTPEQVTAIQTAGADLLNQFNAALPVGVTPTVSITNTPTGAVFNGVLVSPTTGANIPVPVDDVVVIKSVQAAVMIAAADTADQPANLDANGILVANTGGTVGAVAYGFGASTPGELVIMSTPRLLGTFTTDANGAFIGQVTLPLDLVVGDHTVAIVTNQLAASLGVRIDPAATLPTTGASPNLGLIALWMSVIGVGVFVISRRRLFDIM
jgi:hypothetical protein